MGGAPQVAMRVALQIWQIVFASQTLQVFCFYFANPSGFSFGPSQKGTICSSECEKIIYFNNKNCCKFHEHRSWYANELVFHYVYPI
jgi:hypothetical protein